MAVPRNRLSNAKKKKKRAQKIKLQKINVITCKSCQKDTLPHRICECGFYHKTSSKEKKPLLEEKPDNK